MKMIEKPIQISKNFHANEFKCKCGCGKIYISDELVQKLQKISDHFGEPVRISSGYRCAIHNKSVGGSATSKHLLGYAADFCVDGYTSKQVAVIAERIGFDGIAYINDNYLHVDLGGRKWYADERTGKTFTTFQTVTQLTLKRGDSGENVKRLQKTLSDNGYYYADKIDGSFGSKTYGAVMAFQADHGLTVDGIAGKNTLTALGVI